MSNFWQLTLSRWRAFYRDRDLTFWTFGFPILLSIALGIAFRDKPHERVFVAIEEGAGADLIQKTLAAAPDLEPRILSAEEAHRQLRSGKVSLVVVPGPRRTYRFDSTRLDSRLARAAVDDALQRGDGRRDVVVASDAPTTEPGSRYIDFLVPGLIGFNIMQGSLWFVGFAIVEMRSRKLLKRLMASPMKRPQFLASFLALRGLVLLIELPVLLVFAWLVFSVPVRGSLVLLLLLSVLGSLAFSGIGLLLASRAMSPQTFNGMMSFVTMPMFVFSGVFFSSARFPDVMQPFIQALPLTALNDSMRAVILDGASAGEVAIRAAILAAWSLLSFGAALRLFRWR